MLRLRVKSMMENLDELAGLDMVLLREGSRDRREAPNPAPPGWRRVLRGLLDRRRAEPVRVSDRSHGS